MGLNKKAADELSAKKGFTMKKIQCNQCGKIFEYENETATNEFCFVTKDWGYFSKKDGIRHQFVLCEECYDQLIQNFTVPVEVSELTELV